MASKEFRNYDTAQDRVRATYREMRIHQTVDHVKKMHAKYLKFDTPVPVWEALMKVDSFVDSSDPDIDLPNSFHLFQTAEALRKDGEPEWLQVTGLIHDMGKLLYEKGCPEDGTSLDTQWSLVGDTYVVGCRLPDCCVYPELNALNPDMANPAYNTELGQYEAGCGLQNVQCSFGHDEYLYQLLEHNGHALPDEGLAIIRFHSLYPWHQGGAYTQLEDDHDRKMKPWVQKFNKYDLYTKSNDDPPDPDQLRAYYEPLLKKFLGETLKL